PPLQPPPGAVHSRAVSGPQPGWSGPALVPPPGMGVTLINVLPVESETVPPFVEPEVPSVDPPGSPFVLLASPPGSLAPPQALEIPAPKSTNRLVLVTHLNMTCNLPRFSPHDRERASDRVE